LVAVAAVVAWCVAMPRWQGTKRRRLDLDVFARATHAVPAGGTALHATSWQLASTALTQALLSAGADADVKNAAGWTPLNLIVAHWAGGKDGSNLEIAKLLIGGERHSSRARSSGPAAWRPRCLAAPLPRSRQ
jgi:hypothetical protein